MVESCDGEEFELAKARKQSKLMFWFGFCFLPFLWMGNFWLFWPEWRGPYGDPEIKKYCKRSFVLFIVYSVAFIPWVLFYAIAGKKYLNPTVYWKLDVSRLPVSDFVGL